MKKITDTCYLTDNEEFACTSLEGGGYAIVSKQLCNENFDEGIVTTYDTLDEAKAWLERYDVAESKQ